MASSVLRLFHLLNHLGEIDFSRPYVELDALDPPTLLILDPGLAKALSKDTQLCTFNLVQYWQSITQVDTGQIPETSGYFESSPLLLHSARHKESRKRLAPIYKAIESDLSQWIEARTTAFFKAASNADYGSPSTFAEAYVSTIFQKAIARFVGAKEECCPSLPTRIFSFFLRRRELLAYHQSLADLVDWVSGNLSGSKSQAYDLLSLTIMGKEPMIGALTYALCNRLSPSGAPWTADTLMDHTAPVTMLVGREALEDLSVAATKVRKGQIVHISPYLANLKAGDLSLAFPFGHGPHVCQGRTIALAITRAFLNALPLAPRGFSKGTKFMRDNVLVPKEVSA